MSEVTNTLVVLGLLVPMGATALGIGEIRAHSALNQRLNAEIPLVLSGNDSLQTLQIRLASPEAFARAGVERSQNLTQLRFTAIAKSRGEYVIQVSSADVVHEPFLDFLMEVESPAGTSLREFTLLLDPPPGLYPVDSNAFQGSPAFSPAPTPRYDFPGQHRPVSPEREARAYSAETTAAPTRREFAIPPAQLTLEAYGPVRRGERLLEIAQRLERPASVTPEQMAVGLYLANPRAFRGTPNGLRAGSRLRIPTQQFLTQIATEDYAALLRGETPRVANGGMPEPEFMPGAVPGELPQQPDRSNGIGPVGEVSARIASALKKENDELREHVSHLEQRLEEAQRLLTLKSAELAALHQESMKPKESAEARVSVVPRIDPPKLPEPVIHSPPITQTPAPIPGSPPKQPTEPARKPPLVVSQTGGVEQELPIASGFLLASGSLFLVGLSVWLYRRRRATGGGGDLPFMTSPTVSTLSQAQTLATSQTTTPATPLPMPPSDTLVAEADVLDPVWEADVYLRYGRFGQAENLMRDAIKIDPARHDLKLKLLEILHLANKGEAFLAYVQELHLSQPALPGDFWASVSSIRPDFQADTTAPPARITDDELPQPSESGASSDAMAAAMQLEDLHNTDFSQELAELQAQHEQITQNGNILASAAQDASSASDSSMPAAIKLEDTLGGLAGETETSDYSAELRELERQASSAMAQPPGSESTALIEGDGDGPESAPAETSDLDNLIEFEAPQLDSPQEPDKPDFSLDNLIPFDTTNLNAVLPDLQTNPATSGPALIHSNPDLVGIEFEREQNPLPDSSTQRKGHLGSLDFPLELVDPGAPASPELQAGVSSQAGSAIVGLCDELLAQAREFAVNDEKAACRQLLQQVLQQGSPAEREEAEALLQALGKVRLSLVPPPPSRKAS